MRVHELAKKLGMPNKELIDKLQAVGISVKTHSSGVNESEAMKALGLDKPKAEPSKPRRPRTMLRRRKKGEEGEEQQQAEGAEAQADGASTEAQAEQPAAEAQPEQPEQPAADAQAEQPAAEAQPEQPAAEAQAGPPEQPAAEAQDEQPAAEEQAEQPAAEAQAGQAEQPAAEAQAEQPAAQADGESPGAEDGAGKAEGEGKPTPENVVRRIDPEAIKSRLAAEGRDFKPKPKRTFSRVREIRVVNDRFGGAPQMVDVTGQSGRPGRRSGATTRNEGWRDRREARGARDLWMNPGRKKKSGKRGKGTEITQAAAHKRIIEITDVITVGDLAHNMAVKAGQVISKLMGMGMMVTVNQTIDYETAAIVAEEFGFEVKNVAFDETDILDAQVEEKAADDNVEPRAPVVTVMGHVDHGKTSLLDYIRNANVVKGEAGGITQHIGAYSVSTDKGKVTFLDTPGHAAFTAMRARGAEVTDIVILIVAADDGVMPQTKEAIDHAKAAKVPIIVAINKCDKPDAKPERVMQELTEHQIVPEDWGGDTQMVQISALKGTGVDQLLDAVLLQSEMADPPLQADPTVPCRGTVIEAQLDKGRGPVATVLVQHGTLSTGEFMVAGEHSGKVRAMYDSAGKRVKTAGPSTPVQVLGLSGVPAAGDRFDAVTDDKTAKQVAEHRGLKAREEQRMKDTRVSLEDFLTKKKGDEEAQELRLVVKADVGGSMEALKQALERLTTKKVRVNIVGSGVGAITEGDINLALASEAIVIGFNTKPDGKASRFAQHEGVDVRTYNVIYEALDEVREAMTGLLAPKLEERYVGRAIVQATFRVPKIGVIAGCRVTDGKIVRNAKLRVRRGDEVLHEGDMLSLKRFKDDVREVGNGLECGIAVKGFGEFEEEDTIEAFELIEVRPDLDEALVDAQEKAEDKAPPPSGGGGTEAGAPA